MEAESMALKSFNEEDLQLQLITKDYILVFAIDFGAALLKIGYCITLPDDDHQTIRMSTFDHSHIEDAVKFITAVVSKSKMIKNTVIVGFGDNKAGMKEIESSIGFDIRLCDEYSVFARGLYYFLKNTDETDYVYPYADPDLSKLPSFGAFGSSKNESGKLKRAIERSDDDIFPASLCIFGASRKYIALFEDGSFELVDKNYKAGLFYHALGRQLTGCKSYGELQKLTEVGDVCGVTTTMKDFDDMSEYGGFDVDQLRKCIPFNAETFPFGNVIRKNNRDPKKADVARGLLHCVCEDIIEWSARMKVQLGASNTYITGSFLKNNHAAKAFLERIPYISVLGKSGAVNLRFLKFESYTGVIGAIVQQLNSY